MHAILGLAASELIPEDPSFLHAALRHRLLSLRAIKRKLALVAPSSAQASLAPSNCPATTISRDEGNALLATCYALTFQSVRLDDGMAEFMTFVRGVVLVAINMVASRARILFANMGGQEQEDVLRPYLDAVFVPPGMGQWSAGVEAGLEGMRSLCEGDGLKVKYWELTMDVARKLRGDPFTCKVFSYFCALLELLLMGIYVTCQLGKPCRSTTSGGCSCHTWILRELWTQPTRSLCFSLVIVSQSFFPCGLWSIKRFPVNDPLVVGTQGSESSRSCATSPTQRGVYPQSTKKNDPTMSKEAWRDG